MAAWRHALGTYGVSGTSVRLAFDAPPGAFSDYRNVAEATLSGADLVVTRREVRSGGLTTVDPTELRYTRQPWVVRCRDDRVGGGELLAPDAVAR